MSKVTLEEGKDFVEAASYVVVNKTEVMKSMVETVLDVFKAGVFREQNGKISVQISN